MYDYTKNDRLFYAESSRTYVYSNEGKLSYTFKKAFRDREIKDLPNDLQYAYTTRSKRLVPKKNLYTHNGIIRGMRNIHHKTLENTTTYKCMMISLKSITISYMILTVSLIKVEIIKFLRYAISIVLIMQLINTVLSNANTVVQCLMHKKKSKSIQYD